MKNNLKKSVLFAGCSLLLLSACSGANAQIQNGQDKLFTIGETSITREDEYDLIKKAKRVMGTYREILGSEGKLNPSTLIFWQKNYDGLKDIQDITITPNTGMEADSTPEQIEADIPIDVEAEEL